MMQSPIVHAELHTKDVPKEKSFYTELFGWELHEQEIGGSTYNMMPAENGPGIGMMESPAPEEPPHWMLYVGVEDLDASSKRVEALGGKIVQSRIDIPQMGAFSVVQDPAGAVFGIWEAAR